MNYVYIIYKTTDLSRKTYIHTIFIHFYLKINLELQPHSTNNQQDWLELVSNQ